MRLVTQISWFQLRHSSRLLWWFLMHCSSKCIVAAITRMIYLQWIIRDNLLECNNIGTTCKNTWMPVLQQQSQQQNSGRRQFTIGFFRFYYAFVVQNMRKKCLIRINKLETMELTRKIMATIENMKKKMVVMISASQDSSQQPPHIHLIIMILELSREQNPDF